MKICHIVPSLAERHGGPSKSVPALVDALARSGHEVTLLTTGDRDSVDEYHTAAGAKVTTFPRSFPTAVGASGLLARRLDASQFDVIHHHALWLRTLRYAANASRRRGTPLVISPRGMMTPWAWRHHRWRKALAASVLHPGALPHAAAWHCTSAQEAEEIQALGFTQPCCVAPNGVDIPDSSQIAREREHWHRLCPETAALRTAVFYGRFHQKKRVLELIDLWIEAAPKDWFLIIVGVPEQYSPATLNAYIHNQMAGGRLRAFSGAQQPPPYAVGELFLLPSHSENFGMTVAEALAHGLPALVTDTTPWQPLHRIEGGWCVPWESYGELLRHATAQPAAELAARGNRARNWVEHTYAWDATVRPLNAMYDRLAAHG